MVRQQHDNKDLILATEAIQILKVTNVRSLQRYKKKYPITEIEQGNGKPKLYLKSEIEELSTKINPKKNIVKKAEKIKKDIHDRKVKNKKLKVEVKKDLGIKPKKESIKKEIIETCKEVIEEDFNLFDDEDIIKPQLDTKDFTMSDLLNEIGQDEFNRVVELLKENGTYKEQDRALVLTYAVSYQNWVYATIASAKQDNTTMDNFGNLKLHPYMVVSDKCLSQMAKIGAILGLGARSRLGLDIAAKKKQTISDIINSKESFN